MGERQIGIAVIALLLLLAGFAWLRTADEVIDYEQDGICISPPGPDYSFEGTVQDGKAVIFVRGRGALVMTITAGPNVAVGQRDAERARSSPGHALAVQGRENEFILAEPAGQVAHIVLEANVQTARSGLVNGVRFCS